MANVRNANTLYIDSTGTGLTGRNSVVVGVIVSATSANGKLVLADSTTTATKLDLEVPSAGDTHHFDLSSSPIIFPNGINAVTVTNCVATVILTGVGG